MKTTYTLFDPTTQSSFSMSIKITPCLESTPKTAAAYSGEPGGKSIPAISFFTNDNLKAKSSGAQANSSGGGS